MRISWILLALIIGSFTANTAADSAILGGIGTGKLEIRPDGRLASFTLNHNPHQPIDDSTGCFAAISVVSENRMVVKRLYSDANDPEAIEKVRVQPDYPYARVNFEDTQLPVVVSLDAYSPFVPGSIESSCYPAVVFRYTVQNTMSQEVAVTVAMSWRNWIGRGGTAQEIFDATGVFSHRLYRRGNDTGILYQLTKTNPTGAARNALGEQALIYRAQQKETAAVLPLWHPESETIGLRLFMEKTEDYLKSKDAEFDRPQMDNSRPAAVIAARRTIPAGESRTFTFLLAWRMPYRIGKDDTDYGVFYATRWNSIQNVLDDLGKKNAALVESMNAWETTYRSSSLPGWLFDRMRNGMAILARDGVFLADGRFTMLSGNPDYPGNLGAPEERLADASFLLQYFPDLLRSELDLISQCQLADGEIPSALGNLYGAIGNGNVPGGFIGNPDSSSAYVLLAYQYYLWTGDRKFLDDHSRHLRFALRWLMARDRNSDMIPDGPSLWPWAGEGVTSLFSGNLAMAAFRVGEELEQIYQDLEFQTWCRQQGQGIARNLGSQLWNGNYYNAFFDARFPTRQDGSEMIPGLLGGEWFALHQGWKSLLPPARLTSAIQSMAIALPSFEKSRSANREAAWNYGYAPAFAGTALLRYGFIDAASRLIPPQASIPEAGWWSYAAALSGFGLDLHRRCLVIGPVLPSASDTFACPFSSPLYSGQIVYNRSRLSGQQECEILFDRLSGGKDAALLQIAFAFPQSADANESAMQVYHNGQSVAGQDFSRESLRVFGFQPALRLKTGDRLSLLLAPKGGPRVIVDVQSREIRNFGGKCRIDKTGLTIPGVSFYISNLLPGKQWLSLDLMNPAPQQEYAVFLNGQKQSFSVPSSEPVPLILPQSPISSENLAFLHTTVKACQDTAVKFASVTGREDLKKKLWSLQEEANRLVDLDAGQRGMRFDIIPITVLDQFKLQEIEKSDRPFHDDLQRLRENSNAFMADIQKQSNDPVLASELTGYFVPLAVQISVDEIVSASQAFTLVVRAENLLQSPLTGRFHLDLPEQWRAIAGSDVVFDDRQSAEDERRLAFSIYPNADLWQKRFPIQVNVSGTWNEFPYRKSQSVYVGHEFVKRWMIVGPFPNERGEGFSRMIPPENNIQIRATYTGIGGDVGWKEYEFPDGYVNLDAVLTPNDNAVAYAYTSLYSPREQAVQVRVGCNGDLKLFLNYKESYAKRNVNRPQPGGETIPIRLFEGWNHLVVKLSERTGPWGFYIEVYDLLGKPIEGIQFALDKVE